MSLNVLNQVWAADMAFLKDMYLLDADFFRFVWGLLQQKEAVAPATAALAAHAGTKVRFDIYALYLPYMSCFLATAVYVLVSRRTVFHTYVTT